MLAHDAAVCDFGNHRAADLALDRQVEVIVSGQLGGFIALEPGHVGAVRNRRIDERRNGVGREPAIHGERRGEPLVDAVVGLGQGPTGVVRRTADGNQGCRKNANKNRGLRSWRLWNKRNRCADHRSLYPISRPESGCPRNRCKCPRITPRRECCPRPDSGVVGPKSVQRLPRPVGGRFTS